MFCGARHILFVRRGGKMALLIIKVADPWPIWKKLVWATANVERYVHRTQFETLHFPPATLSKNHMLVEFMCSAQPHSFGEAKELEDPPLSLKSAVLEHNGFLVNCNDDGQIAIYRHGSRVCTVNEPMNINNRTVTLWHQREPGSSSGLVLVLAFPQASAVQEPRHDVTVYDCIRLRPPSWC